MMRIAIVRALQLGDMLCAVPAMRALRAHSPDAHVTLIGLPWAQELVRLLPRYIDEFEEFPGFPGIPERAFDVHRVAAFVTEMQRRHFDLAIQLHGSGSHINEFVALLGARRMAAFRRADDVVIDGGTFVEWPTTGSEVERLLALTTALGCPDMGTALELEVRDTHRAEWYATEVARALNGRPYVCIHPGARFLSRRWASDRFAIIGDAMAARGYAVVLTGSRSEAEVTAAVGAAMRAPSLDLAGALTLGALTALIAAASLVVCNDTGISHVAAAVGAPSVVIASGSDVGRWAPLDRELHPVLWRDMPCRPCMHVTCPTGHECANAVSVEDVLASIEELMHARMAHA
jgi:ADP-heptose:LPS heptosyltransferase